MSSRTFAVLALAISVSAARGARADESHVEGVVGASAGFNLQTGRSVAIDAVSGASDVDTNEFTDAGFTGGLVLDLALEPAGRGSLGVHAYLDATGPGPFFALGVMPRYRRPLGLGRGVLRAFEPWAGIGVGVEIKDDVSERFITFPFGLGCDLRLALGAVVTTEIDVTMINPWGPMHTDESDTGTMQRYVDHMNRLAIKIGVAWPF